MTIVRSPRPDSGYLTISNDLARDESLSFRARGVLVAILSRPDNWTTSATQLASEGKEGRDAILTALDELEDARYVRREKTQDAGGKWSTRTIVFDAPEPENPSSVPLGETISPLVAPETEKPDSVFQASKEVPRRSTKDMSAEADASDEATSGSPSSSASVDLFDEFWKVYPRTRDTSKAAARLSFARKSKTVDPAAIVRAAVRFAHLCTVAGKQEQFIAHPSTWLNQERYNNADVNGSDPEPAGVSGGWW